MATAELTQSPGGRASGASWLGAALASYIALWSLTLAGAALIALTAPAHVRGAMGLTLTAAGTPRPSPGRVLALAAHNLPICAWPLLLGLLRPRRGSVPSRVADAVVAACAIANVLPVAAALGGYGAALVPYVVQLPIEWAALAGGYGSWITEREYPLMRNERLWRLSIVSVLALGAAALETYGVPNR